MLMCVVYIHPLVLHEQTACIPATKLVWTLVILNGSKASGALTNGRVYKSFETKRGVQVNHSKPFCLCVYMQAEGNRDNFAHNLSIQVEWLSDAWLPQVRMINVAVILVPFLCFEWTCVWPYTSGKVLPLPTTQLHKLSSPTWLFITVWRVHSHMTSLDVAVCSSKPTLTCCAGNSHR